MLLGAAPSGSTALYMGVLEILSTKELSVTAVYTASDGEAGGPAIDIQQIKPRVLSI
jgi:hypothetical protein